MNHDDEDEYTNRCLSASCSFYSYTPHFPSSCSLPSLYLSLIVDAYAGVPSHSANEWFSGSNKAPMVVSLNPYSSDKTPHEVDLERMAEMSGSTKEGASIKAYVAPKSVPEMQKELDRANAKIAELEAKLKLHNIS
jgi:hypothetical protein